MRRCSIAPFAVRGTGWPPGALWVLNRRPTGIRASSWLYDRCWRPLCRHGERAIRLPASGNFGTRASSSRVRLLAAMPNGLRAGSLVATDSTNQK
jgi:hypothetical protein